MIDVACGTDDDGLDLQGGRAAPRERAQMLTPCGLLSPS